MHCPMMTPDFPLWSQRFEAECRRLRKGTGQTLHQLETLFGSWIGHFRLAPQEEGPLSRQRDWPLRLVDCRRRRRVFPPRRLAARS